MRALTRSLAAGALVAGAFATSAPAQAATRCAGEQTLVYVCVVTPSVGTEDHTYCVYAGGSSCTPVTVPVPELNGQVDVTCGGVLVGCNGIEIFERRP